MPTPHAAAFLIEMFANTNTFILLGPKRGKNPLLVFPRKIPRTTPCLLLSNIAFNKTQPQGILPEFTKDLNLSVASQNLRKVSPGNPRKF